jgi:hypothetical protein
VPALLPVSNRPHNPHRLGIQFCELGDFAPEKASSRQRRPQWGHRSELQKKRRAVEGKDVLV